MKFFSKLVKAVSAVVASFMVGLSGSAVFADGIGLWPNGASTSLPARYVFYPTSLSLFTVKRGGKVVGKFKKNKDDSWTYISPENGVMKPEAKIAKVSDSEYEETDLIGLFKGEVIGKLKREKDGSWSAFDTSGTKPRLIHKISEKKGLFVEIGVEGDESGKAHGKFQVKGCYDHMVPFVLLLAQGRFV